MFTKEDKTIITLVFVCFVAIVIYAYTESIKLKEFKQECVAKGGTPMPTDVYYSKVGKQYGDYICADIKVIK